MHLAAHRKNSALALNRLVDLTECYARCRVSETDAGACALVRARATRAAPPPTERSPSVRSKSVSDFLRRTSPRQTLATFIAVGAFGRLSLALRWGRLAHPLSVPRQVRHDPEQPLDDHELRPMMNFMFFGPKQHIQTAFRTDTVREDLFGQ